MHMDIPLLIDLARRHCNWSFVFVGPRGYLVGHEAALEELALLPNVYMLGPRAIAELPSYVQQFDVGMLCYVVNDYTRYIYPLKMHEYLASGLPIVGSPIKALEDFTHVVSLASGPHEWSRALEAALGSAARSADKIRVRQEVAREHDWGRHAVKIARAICDRLGAHAEEIFESVDIK